VTILRKHILLLTGNPGIGKTTVLLKVIEALREKGYSVGGMISREVRSCNTRVGFEILDLSSERRGWLAHVNQKTGPKVGKYRVNPEDLNGVGVEAILWAVKECEIIVIDEIGPMEFFSEKFREVVRKAFESDKLVIGVVHWKVRDKLVEDVKRRGDAEIITVALGNRDGLHQIVIRKAIDFLTSTKRNP
jgi:nucleoside-triphosphatase